MKPIERCLIFAMVMAIAACAATSAHMENEEGAEVDCSKWGVGFVFAPLALIRSTNCVKKLQEAGYHKVDANAPLASAPQTAASGQKP